MKKINGKWIHEGQEYEVVYGPCRACMFVKNLSGCKFDGVWCAQLIGPNRIFKLKEKNMIEPFKCVLSSMEQSVAIRQSLYDRGLIENVQRVPNSLFRFNHVGPDSTTNLESFEMWPELLMTFYDAMQMILAAPVRVPAPKFEFQPFDQILRQNKLSETWMIGFYSHIEPNNFIGLNGAIATRMLPYKGNEHLLNARGRPDGWWEVKNGEPVWRTE